MRQGSRHRGRLTVGLLLSAVLAAAVAAARPADLDEIRRLAGRGRTEQALRRLEQLLVADPSQADGQLLRGALLYDLGRLADAERVFRDLSIERPDLPEPANNLAVMHALSGRRANALIRLREVLADHPDYQIAARNLEAIRAAPAPLSADLRYPPGSALDLEGQAAARPRLVLARRLGERPAPPAAPAPPKAPPESSVSAKRGPKPAVLPPADIVVRSPPAAESEPTAGTPDPATEPAVAEPADPEQDPSPTDAGEDKLERPMPAAPASPSPAPSPPPVEPPPTAPAAPATAPAAEPSPAVSGTTDTKAQLAAVVAGWAAAWSEQRVKEYLAYYAADFEPEGFPSRRAWEAVRRQRVAAPEFIEIDIDLESMLVDAGPGAGEATVVFTQGYRSDRFADTVEKTLVMVREAGAWRIRRETSR